MNTYSFTLVLEGVDEMSEELAEKLYGAGCDDALAASSEGEAVVEFDRQAESYEHAIRSAIDNVHSIGVKVAKVVIDLNEFQSSGQSVSSQVAS